MSFTVYPLDDVAQLFPPQEGSNSEIIQTKKTTIAQLDALSRSPQSFQIGLAIGIIIMLGSIFAILAAHQIMPTGLNAFNQLGTGSYVIGYGLLAAGFITTLVTAVKWWSFNNAIATKRYIASEGLKSFENGAKIRAIQANLTDDEMLVISAECYGTMSSFLLTKEKHYFPQQMTYEQFWAHTPHGEVQTHQKLLKDKHFTTLDELRQRV